MTAERGKNSSNSNNSSDDTLQNGENADVTEGDNVLETEIQDPVDDDDDDDAVPEQADPTDHPKAVDDFLRNFLNEKGMTKTLDVFEREWYGKLEMGLMKSDAIDTVPDVFIKNMRLEGELKKLRQENEGYRAAALAAADTIVKIQKQRDFHRLQHKCALEEKNALIEETRKLNVQCSRFEPSIKKLNDRYQSALRQKMLVSLERDHLLEENSTLQATLRNTGLLEDPSPSQDSNDRSQRKDLSKEPSKFSQLSKHPKDSVFPQSTCATHLQAFLKVTSVAEDVPTKANFHLKRAIMAHNQPISCLTYHPKKSVLASASDDQVWKLWGLPEGDMIATGKGHTDWLAGISFHPDGSKLGSTGGDSSLRIWDLSAGRLLLTLEGHGSATWGCSFHSCGDFVASCSMDCTVKVWDLQSERCRSTLHGHSGWVNSVEFLPLSNTLLSSSADKTLSLWDTRTATCIQTIFGHSSSCNHATFTPSGRAIASCDSRGIVMLWDIRNMAAPTVVMETGPKPSNQVAFNPNGQLLAVAGDDTLVRVLNLTTNKVACSLGHDNAVQSVIFDLKGDYLLSGASDGNIYCWST